MNQSNVMETAKWHNRAIFMANQEKIIEQTKPSNYDVIKLGYTYGLRLKRTKPTVPRDLWHGDNVENKQQRRK